MVEEHRRCLQRLKHREGDQQRCAAAGVASLSETQPLRNAGPRMSWQDCRERMQVPCTPACTPVPCVCVLTASLDNPGLHFL